MEDENMIPDFVLDALQDPGCRDTPEFCRWIASDEGNRQLFEEMQCCREAALRQLPDNRPDIEEQWREVSSRTLGRQTPAPRRAKILRWQAVVVAAAAALLLIFIWNRYLQQSDSAPLALSKNPVKVFDRQPADPNHVVVVKAVSSVPPVLITDSHGRRHVLTASSISYTAVATEVPPEQLVLSTPRGKSVKVILNDSTEVWLNGESRLTYPSRFTGDTRTVRLEGEAYFKVEHNASRPFIVEHGGVTTRALGTAFNIRSYNDVKRHITLVNGSVMVTDTTSKKKEVLKPGQDLAYTSTLSDKTVKAVDTEEYTSWTEGLFCFDNAGITEIMQELGRWYNVTVIFADKDAARYHFSFWADRNAPLSETVSLLSQIGTVRVQTDARNRRVIVRKR